MLLLVVLERKEKQGPSVFGPCGLGRWCSSSSSTTLWNFLSEESCCVSSELHHHHHGRALIMNIWISNQPFGFGLKVVSHDNLPKQIPKCPCFIRKPKHQLFMLCLVGIWYWRSGFRIGRLISLIYHACPGCCFWVRASSNWISSKLINGEGREIFCFKTNVLWVVNRNPNTWLHTLIFLKFKYSFLFLVRSGRGRNSKYYEYHILIPPYVTNEVDNYNMSWESCQMKWTATFAYHIFIKHDMILQYHG